MSVILQVAADPFSFFLPFFNVLGRELGASFGGGFGTFLGEVFARGAGQIGGNGGSAGFFFGNGGNGGAGGLLGSGNFGIGV